MAVAMGGHKILKVVAGPNSDSAIANEGTWTLEDRKMIRIVLTKMRRDAANCWTSLPRMNMKLCIRFKTKCRENLH